MGINVSTCLADNCAKENDLAFSAVLSEDSHHLGIISPQGLPNALKAAEIISEKLQNIKIEESLLQNVKTDLESPRSEDSNESVMSTISPTKQKSINSKKRQKQSIVSPIQTRFPTIEQLQLSQGMETDMYDKAVLDQINYLIACGDVKKLDNLLTSGDVDISKVLLQELQYSPVHVAVIAIQQDMAHYLLEKGVDINIRDADGQTAIFLAYSLGSFELTNLLVSYKAAEFAMSPYSPYSRSMSAASESGRRIASAGDFEGGGGEEDVICLTRDNSFRSFKSIDSTIQRASSVKAGSVKKAKSFDALPVPAARSEEAKDSCTIEFSRWESFRVLPSIADDHEEEPPHNIAEEMKQADEDAAPLLRRDLKHHPVSIDTVQSPFHEDPTAALSGSLTNDFSSDASPSAALLRGGRKPLGRRLRKAAGKVLSFVVPGAIARAATRHAFL